MWFRQLIDRETSTYSYVLADEHTRDAVIIDPVLAQVERDLGLIADLGLRLIYALDTHLHADHVSALGALRDRLGARAVVSRHAGVGCADLAVGEGDVLRFGGHALRVLETPGHTAGCVSYVEPGAAMVFTGDALLIRGCGRTDFQGGCAHQLYRSVHDKLFALPGATLIYPGHDYHGRTATTVDEERRLNPRLGGATTVDEFAAIMSRLGLARPQQMAQALARNASCGQAIAP